MRSRFGAALSALFILATPSHSFGQDVEVLIREGRFEDAVDRSAGAVPEEADRIAERILEQAFVQGYEVENFQYALRGIVAAKRLPGLERDRRQELEYWHAWSLYMLAERIQIAGTPAAAERALPHFVEAREIVNRIDRNLYDVFDLDSSIAEYIQVMRAVVRSG